MTGPICQASRKDGAPCRARSLPGEAWCWAHHPERQEIAAAARSNGAVKANKLRALRGRRPRLDSARALIRFASEVVQDVLSGEVSPDVGRVVLYGCATLKGLVEVGDLEKRLEALEQRLAEGGRKWA